jgi:hypothetical protein
MKQLPGTFWGIDLQYGRWPPSSFTDSKIPDKCLNYWEHNLLKLSTTNSLPIVAVLFEDLGLWGVLASA